MPSEAYQLFLRSMTIGFDQWHDGTGYDLEALGRLGPEERASIEELLIEHLREAGDWRDVEALAVLGTASAHAAVDKARFHSNAKVRSHAVRVALEPRNCGDATRERMAELEGQVVEAVAHGDYVMAESMPTMRVKKALLDLAREADSETRVSAAAFLLYLCGQASEPFDWSQRPFFLRFGEDDSEVLQQAWEELRKRAGL